MSSPAAAIEQGRARVALARQRVSAAAPHVLLLSGALAAWIHALEHTDLKRISGFGLLSAVPASYYLALLALAAGFALAIARRSSPALLGLYVFALILALHATTPLLYSEPRYAWTYKHIGVAGYISHFGATDRSIDIYQNWPAFFGLLGALQSASGVSLAALASWSEVFFECAYVGAIAFLLRGVTRQWRVILTAAWLFVLANWLGQDYLAPQSFAYLLSLVLIAVCIRCAPAPRSTAARSALAARWWRRLARMQLSRSSPFVDDAASAPLRPPLALPVGALLFAAIAMSHQLSPLLCIAVLVAFALTTRRLRAVPLIAMAAFEAAWIALAWPLLSSKYHVLEISPLERPVSAGGNPTWALPGFGDSVIAARASIAIVCALAVAGLWRRARNGHFDLPLVAIVLLPALVVACQPYGGEGVFRLYIFALPWLCFLAATLLLSVPRPRGLRALGARVPGASVAVVSVLLAGSFLFASYGREIVNYIVPEDVAVELAYERDAPPGSAVLYLAPNAPNRMTWRYAQKQVWAGSFSPSLTEDPHFVRHALGVGDLPAIEAKLRSLQASAAYLMISPSEIHYVEAYGLLAPGSVGSLITALLASNDFQLVARDGNGMLFRLREPGGRVR